MAGLAPDRLSVFADFGHALLELAVVHVFVATRTGEILKMIWNFGFRLILGRELVAIAAGHRDMPASQLKLRLLMLRQRERRWAVALQVVALVTLILIGLAHELIVVFIHVTIRAALEVRDFEDRVLTFRGMALIALHLRVTFDQGVVRLGMGLYIEQRRLPSLHVVTGRAFDSFRPLGELPLVLIFMAIRALRESQLLLKIPVGMAEQAVDGGVLSQQRVFGFGVVEVRV